jgi:hypothetical protein
MRKRNVVITAIAFILASFATSNKPGSLKPGNSILIYNVNVIDVANGKAAKK